MARITAVALKISFVCWKTGEVKPSPIMAPSSSCFRALMQRMVGAALIMALPFALGASTQHSCSRANSHHFFQASKPTPGPHGPTSKLACRAGGPRRLVAPKCSSNWAGRRRSAAHFCECLQEEFRAARQPRPANRDQFLPHRETDNIPFGLGNFFRSPVRTHKLPA